MTSFLQLLVCVVAAVSTTACALVGPITPQPTAAGGPTTMSSREEAQYAALYPYYAEICALSELEKRPGFGADIFSGIGGHAVIYLNGVCRRKDTSYPVLAFCDDAAAKPAGDGDGDGDGDGVGLSVNAHYKNATWVAIEGRQFFFTGGLEPGRTLTRATYQTIQAEARARKIYDGVVFHDVVYDGMPGGFTRESFKYEISVATDYAIAFGRNRYCARVPLDHGRMSRIIDYLNGVNQPYRDGAKVFEWNVLTHNCSHINHNALAAAGLWPRWPMDRPVLISMFDFPVPLNEVVNTMRRTNDMPIDDLGAMFRDKAARALMLDEGRLPTEPGGLLDVGTIIAPNDIYDTTSRIIFYDDPVTGRYERRFKAIRGDPRYFRLRDNLLAFAELYRKIARDREPVERYLGRHPLMSAADKTVFRLFYRRYYAYIEKQTHEVDRDIAFLDDKTYPIPESTNLP